VKRAFLCALVLLACARVTGAAQEVSRPADLRGLGFGTGSRVRLTAPSIAEHPLVGRVAGLTVDSLLLERGGGARLQIDSREVRALSVSAGHDRWRGALIGAGIGLLTGGVLGARAAGHNDDTGLAAFVGFVAGVVVGTPLGAGVGALAAPERWIALPVPPRGS
jgi:hypothetical protein